MTNAATFWDKTAEKYAESPIADLDSYNFTLERTRRYLSPNDRVLEVGCGTGSTALLLAGDVGRIVASDFSPKMIEIAQRKARDEGVTNAEFITADLLDDPVGDGPYDAVLAFNVLHLLPDSPAAIQRFHGLLKPDGLFISKTVCQPGKGAPLKFRLLKALLPVMQWVGLAPYVNFMSSRTLDDTIEAQGFKVIETHDQAPSRYIVARKV